MVSVGMLFGDMLEGLSAPLFSDPDFNASRLPECPPPQLKWMNILQLQTGQNIKIIEIHRVIPSPYYSTPPFHGSKDVISSPPEPSFLGERLILRERD
jgi:hypothetical protein